MGRKNKNMNIDKDRNADLEAEIQKKIEEAEKKLAEELYIDSDEEDDSLPKVEESKITPDTKTDVPVTTIAIDNSDEFIPPELTAYEYKKLKAQIQKSRAASDKRRADVLSQKKYHCVTCDRCFTGITALKKHYTSAKHIDNTKILLEKTRSLPTIRPQ